LLDLKIHLLLIRAPEAVAAAETAVEEAAAAADLDQLPVPANAVGLLNVAEEAEAETAAAGEEAETAAAGEEEPRSYLKGGDLPVLSMIGEVHFCPPGLFVCPHLQQLHLQSTLQS
jgi:hypothetical protein